ncbi:MAG: hypothetical protein ACREDU_07150 [Methylocella sp.]
MAHGLLARIALAEGNFEEAETRLGQALTLVEQAEVPLAAWRVHAVAAEFEARQGHQADAEHHQERSARVIRELLDRLGHEAELRSNLLGAGQDIHRPPDSAVASQTFETG